MRFTMRKTARIALILILLFMTALNSGCNTLKTKRKQTMSGWIDYGEWTPFKFQHDLRREKYILEHPETDKEVADCISKGMVCDDMSMAEALASWGEPTEKEIETGDDGLVYELWYYMRASDKYQFLLFRDGKLKKIQDKVTHKPRMRTVFY